MICFITFFTVFLIFISSFLLNSSVAGILLGKYWCFSSSLVNSLFHSNFLRYVHTILRRSYKTGLLNIFFFLFIWVQSGCGLNVDWLKNILSRPFSFCFLLFISFHLCIRIFWVLTPIPIDIIIDCWLRQGRQIKSHLAFSNLLPRLGVWRRTRDLFYYYYLKLEEIIFTGTQNSKLEKKNR